MGLLGTYERQCQIVSCSRPGPLRLLMLCHHKNQTDQGEKNRDALILFTAQAAASDQYTYLYVPESLAACLQCKVDALPACVAAPRLRVLRPP
jgi:hypothetical protein